MTLEPAVFSINLTKILLFADVAEEEGLPPGTTAAAGITRSSWRAASG